jgi:predicted hydrocarbon binding protein
MQPDQVAPRARNHFLEEDYFSLNVRNGIVRSPTGIRMVGIPEELIAGLHAALEDETGSASPVVQYSCGRWWGRQFIRRHAIELRQMYGMELGELPLHFQQQVFRRIWALYGWGAIDVDFGLREKGFVEATVANAIYSDVVGQQNRTTDHLVAGVLGATFSELAGRDLESTEIACRSKGDPRCSFVVGLGSRIEVVSAWVKQGRSRAEVLEALARGELA